MEVVKYIISIIIGGSFVTAVLVYIGKVFIGKIFDGMVETYKYRLSIELEEYKITHSKLHIDRSNVIIELYKRLVMLEDEIELFVGMNVLIDKDRPLPRIGESPKYGIDLFNEISKKLEKNTIKDFCYFVKVNDIFFSSDIITELIELNRNLETIDAIKESVRDFVEKNNFNFNTTDLDNFNEILQRNLNTIKDIKKELKNEFRNLLGVK